MLFHRFLVLVLLLLFCFLYANGNESTFELSDSDVNLNEVKKSDDLDLNSCRNSSWCWNGGTCDNGKCSCVPGTSGTFCEVVEECEVNQRKKCGNADNVFCVFNPTSGSAYCGCIDLEQRYDPYDQKCKECDCGHESRGTCNFEKGEKKCTCFEGNGISTDKYGKMDKCLTCSCGSHGHGCEFDSDYRETCFCDAGFAKTSYRCEECDCGPNGNCSLEYSYRKKCECEKGFKERDGSCEVCDCGEDGECDWQDDVGEKFCICKTGYGVNNGICVGCDCYLGDNPVTCTFPDGIKKCSCPEGYEEINSSCVDINECLNETACPMYADCVNSPGSYDCICRSGFRPIVDPSNSTEIPEAEEQNEDGQQPVQRIIGCDDINECVETDLCSFNDTTTCINTPGSYICVCQTGFAVPPGESSAQNGCVRVPPPRDYTTLYTVLAVVFGLIFIGVTGFFVFRMYLRR